MPDLTSAGGPGPRVLVAGIGNEFRRDDGFGVEVVRRITRSGGPAVLPPGVDVADYGIRGAHLAYHLLDNRYDTLILVAAVPLADVPGTLAVLDVGAVSIADGPASAGSAVVDGYATSPQAVLGMLRDLGARVERVLVVGCQPATVEEGVGLSRSVEAAAGEAVRAVVGLAREHAAGPRRAQAPT